MDRQRGGPVAGQPDDRDASGMGHLWRIVQAHLDKYGVREAEFARRLGTKPQTLNSWKNRGVRELPRRSFLEALSELTGTPYDDVLRAALLDIGYLQEGVAHGDAAPTKHAGGSPAQESG